MRLTLCCLTLLVPVSHLFAEAEKDEVRFNEHIRPILSETCLACHGPDAKKREADLRLDIEEAAKKSAVVPGNPERSELIKRVISSDPDFRMPPPESGIVLNGRQIKLLRRWIEQGANYEGHWAFQPIRNYSPPKVGDPALTDIDRFIVSALRERGLSLSKPLSRLQLIRRATFDLTGLPPKWSDVEAFVKDPNPRAFEAVVDRLLKTPQYGERWGRHWLDLARYADTHGGSAIGFTRFPFSYTYRDYVVGAFNKDLPYDRFILEQIAADQLDLDARDPARAALGFLTVGMQYRNRHDLIDDQIDVVTRGLLGLTVTCARCHDHKFDPIPTTDYYSLHATFASSQVPETLPFVGRSNMTDAHRRYQRELKKRQLALDDITRDQSVVMRSRLRMQVGLYLRELAKGVPEQDLSTSFLSYRTDDLRPAILERWRKYLKSLSDEDPVFGPWHRLSRLQKEGFANQCRLLVESLMKENGDPKKFAAEHLFNTKPPRWNPRVLEAIAAKKPESLVDVADAYGSVFADTHRQWLKSLLEASIEAGPDGKVVPDQDARHSVINSSIQRQLRRHLYAPGSPTALALDDAWNGKLINRNVRDHINGARGAIHQLNLTPDSPPRAMELRESKQPEEAFVFVRGNPINRGQRVEAQFLSILSAGKPKPFPDGQRRLGLAQAIVDPANPLTRRVIVNWVWQHHFGRGLVRTPDDFGARGNPPTHSRLLDYLSQSFLADGWSIKKLHRRIMLSAVYQQAAIEDKNSRAKDPDNELLWRMPRRKLELEAMRDSMLAVSGELELKLGGRPFEGKSKRRSLYAFVNRDIVPPLTSTFDGPNPSSCTVKRPETMVPQQTLFALNSEFIQDRAKALVSLPEIKSAKSDAERVQTLYRRVYARSPKPEEVDIALEYIQTQADSKGAPWELFAHVLLAANEFHFVD